jgi:hypothetical protein
MAMNCRRTQGQLLQKWRWTKDAKVIPGYVLVKQDNTSGKFGNGDQTATFYL